MKALFVCVNRDGSADSFVYRRGGAAVWAGRPASATFLDDLGSAEMTTREDLRPLERIFEALRAGRAPDFAPRAVVFFDGRRFGNRQAWDKALREAEAGAESAADLADWAFRNQAARAFHMGKQCLVR